MAKEGIIKNKVNSKKITRRENKRAIMQEYKNFIENRHSVAHSNRSISISWEEVKNIDKVGEKIINAVQDSLSLS